MPGLDELLLRLEALAADAVPALVRAEVDVAVGLDLLPDLCHEARVALLVRPDEVVGLDLELGPRLLEAGAHRLDERRGASSFFSAALALDLLAVLVGAR